MFTITISMQFLNAVSRGKKTREIFAEWKNAIEWKIETVRDWNNYRKRNGLTIVDDIENATISLYKGRGNANDWGTDSTRCKGNGAKNVKVLR